MKGVAVRTVGFAIMAIFSLGLILSLFTGILDAAPITCFVYKTFSGVSPDMEMPEYCLTESCSIERETIKSTDPEDQAIYMAAYAIACYNSKRSPCPKSGDSAICYELRFPDGIWITEMGLTTIMERDYESGCMLLPNSMIQTSDGLVNYPGACGDEDKLDWQLRGHETSVFIEYDIKENKVVIR